MRAAASSSKSQGADSSQQGGCSRGAYRGVSERQSAQVLAAELDDVINRTPVTRLQASQKSFKPCRRSFDDMAYGEGFLWLPEPYADVDDDLLWSIRPDTRAWLKKAKRERQRTRARRTLYWFLVLAIGLGALTVTQKPDTLDTLQSLGIEIAQRLGTTPL
jgi:hypothetical protein